MIIKSPFSKIIAGTMTWGIWGKNLDKKQMIDLMNFCLETGITTFDHADIYGGYTNESDFGTAFGESQIKREDIQLISKCGIQLPTENRTTKIHHYNYVNKTYMSVTNLFYKIIINEKRINVACIYQYIAKNRSRLSDILLIKWLMFKCASCFRCIYQYIAKFRSGLSGIQLSYLFTHVLLVSDVFINI